MNGGEQERDSLVYLIPNGFLHLPLVYLLFQKFTVKSCLIKNYFFFLKLLHLGVCVHNRTGSRYYLLYFLKREIEKKKKATKRVK